MMLLVPGLLNAISVRFFCELFSLRLFPYTFRIAVKAKKKLKIQEVLGAVG